MAWVNAIAYEGRWLVWPQIGGGFVGGVDVTPPAVGQNIGEQVTS